MSEQNSQTTNANKIRIITQVLTKALKLWLRTQVSQISELEVEIKASDRQLFSGRIPLVSIFASHAVYQGLLITKIQLIAENIRINIGSVLKGKPLRLLETVQVAGDLIVDEKDLNASLSSDLLSTALSDLLVKVLPTHYPQSQPINWQEILIGNNQIILRGLRVTNSETTPLEICLGLQLLSGHELQVAQIQINHEQGNILEDNHEYNLDLGSDVDIEELTLIPGKLVCRGRINVNP
ncbi:LmeA family phospholipid-binding protein [Nostoc sp. CALU 1950]|uniref:LmeA family phospholipid-binding protein n=1 Tax=Nostoc sp. CALU 1950 TaxID=3104321 RepID=UPI003EB8D0AA